MSTLCVADDANCRVRLELRAERAQLRRREGLADCSHLWARATMLCHPTYRQMSSESAQFFKCSNCDAFTHRKIALFVINYSIYFKAMSWPSKLSPMNRFNQNFYYVLIWKLISYLKYFKLCFYEICGIMFQIINFEMESRPSTNKAVCGIAVS